MTEPIPPLRRTLSRTLGAAAFLLLAGYAAFEARRLIAGPAITIASPRDGSVVAGPVVHITGEARNAAFFAMNDAQAFVDESGRFDEALSPPPGYTVLTLRATDRFGRTAAATVRVTVADYCPARS